MTLETVSWIALIVMILLVIRTGLTCATAMTTTIAGSGSGVTGAGTSLPGTATNTDGDVSLYTEVPVGAAVSNKQLTIGFTSATLKHFTLLATKNMTLYINAASGGSPPMTITLLAGVPLHWNSKCGWPYPFRDADGDAIDVTAMYFTNALVGAANNGTVYITGSKDGTP